MLSVLERSNLTDLLKILPENDKTSLKDGQYNQAREIFSFAIFTVDGKRLISNKNDDFDFNYSKDRLKLDNGPVFEENPALRTLWLRSQDGQFVIAVGQENTYRNKLTIKF
ncbi:sensor histidine kinase family protein [Budvicia aquatica]|uniref:hypothetical protein n=1 Tax=Budvicia aquatica TaxID=82979 RepID=UPI0021013783|nr:hypothetical protein [Budvicia aquatica]